MVSTSKYNVIVVLFTALGSLTYGYAFSVFSTSIGQPGFYAYFGLNPDEKYTQDILGAINAIFSAGAAFGALSISWLPDWVGRKRTIIIAATISLVGGALVAGSANVPMIVTVRLLHGIGVGQCITITPLYITEVAPPHRRGLLAGMNAVGLCTGYFLSSWVGFGAFFATNPTLQWRLPLALSCLFPFLLLAGSAWIPESPRWLLWKGRADEAWAITERLHHSNADHGDQIAAREEFYQMKAQIEFDAAQDTSYWHMFTTPSLRRRILLGAGVLLGAQSCGPLVINNYGVIIYSSLGMTGYMPLLIYAIMIVNGAFWNLISAIIMDRVGRRLLLLIGFGMCAVTLAVETALVAKFAGTDNKAGNSVALFFIFFYMTFFSICVDAVGFVYCSEIFPTTYRAKGVAIGLFTYYASSIAFLTPTANALASIGWRYYLVFVACAAASFVLTYFFVPETAKLSLEEIAELFGETTVVKLTNASADEKAALDEQIMEKEGTVTHREL